MIREKSEAILYGSKQDRKRKDRKADAKNAKEEGHSPFTIHHLLFFQRPNGRLDRVVIIAKRRAHLKHIPHKMYQTAQNDTFRTKRIKVHDLHKIHFRVVGLKDQAKTRAKTLSTFRR